jgi:hypothetical protein
MKLAIDPTRQEDPRTASPEQLLALAVIEQALADLSSNDELIRFEAHEFFLQTRGDAATMRRLYFDALGLDDEYILAQMQATLDPPERPHKKWTFREVYEILPRDRAFTCPQLAPMTTLHTSQFNVRIQHLIRHGMVVRLEAGLFCVTEYEATYHVKRLPPPEPIKITPFYGFDTYPPTPKPRRKRVNGQTMEERHADVLEVLGDADRPMSVTEIGWELESNYEPVRTALESLERQGRVERADRKWQVVPQSVVVAANG